MPSHSAFLGLRGGIAALMVLIITGGSYVLWNGHRALEAGTAAEEATAIVATAARLEAAKSGYVLTGREHFLGDYPAQRAALEDQVRRLAATAPDVARTDVKTLAATVEDLASLGDSALDLARRSRGQEATVDHDRTVELAESGRLKLAVVRVEAEAIAAAATQDRAWHRRQFLHGSRCLAVVTLVGLALLALVLETFQAAPRR